MFWYELVACVCLMIAGILLANSCLKQNAKLLSTMEFGFAPPSTLCFSCDAKTVDYNFVLRTTELLAEKTKPIKKVSSFLITFNSYLVSSICSTLSAKVDQLVCPGSLFWKKVKKSFQ